MAAKSFKSLVSILRTPPIPTSNICNIQRSKGIEEWGLRGRAVILPQSPKAITGQFSKGDVQKRSINQLFINLLEMFNPKKKSTLRVSKKPRLCRRHRTFSLSTQGRRGAEQSSKSARSLVALFPPFKRIMTFRRNRISTASLDSPFRGQLSL